MGDLEDLAKTIACYPGADITAGIEILGGLVLLLTKGKGILGTGNTNNIFLTLFMSHGLLTYYINHMTDICTTGQF